MAKKPKPPAHADFSRLAKSIVDAATNETEEPRSTESPKQAAGRRGGLSGGNARAAKLSSAKRAEIARKAAQARWKNIASE